MRSLDLLAAHLIGDYVLQDNRMATRKLFDASVRAEHVFRYCVPFAVVAFASRASIPRLALFLSLLWITHFVTDSKRWLQNDEWPPGNILNDQAIHAATLAVLGRLLS